MASPPVCLTIAGSDCSSGAGAQADLKTFSAFGIYGLTAITAVVSEIPGLVTAWESVSPDLLTSQLDTLKGGFPLAAIKTGMLATPELVARVCQFLEGLRAPFPLLPVVVDPVMIASSGDRLLVEEAVSLYRERLLPLATVATPNLAEAAALLECPQPGRDELVSTARTFSRRFQCAVILKGGHLPLSEDATDLLHLPGEEEPDDLVWASHPRIPCVDTHGTGCTFAAALTAGLARGSSVEDAFLAAKRYLTGALEHSHRWQIPDSSVGGTIVALNHFHSRLV